MPVILSYDIKVPGDRSHQNSVYNRLQSAFERLGWERVGGSCYRYPKFSTSHITEDWFNHVIPALMLFRALVADGKAVLNKASLDVQTSTGYDPVATTNGKLTVVGQPPLTANAIQLSTPSKLAFGEKKLLTWIDGVNFPY